MTEAPFTRELEDGEVGPDVEGIGRALARGEPDVGYVSLTTFSRMPLAWRRTYGLGKRRAVNEIRRRQGRSRNGRYDYEVHEWLEVRDRFDAKSVNLMRLYEPPVALCYPIPRGFPGGICQGLHETAGVPGNWAIDFCVPEITGNLTPIVAVEMGFISRLSGSDPVGDVPDPSGAFGWNIRYRTPAGYEYFWTHFGRKATLILGQRVLPGQVIGWVGDQLFRPDHIHGGATSPLGELDAQRKILRVNAAPRVSVGSPV